MIELPPDLAYDFGECEFVHHGPPTESNPYDPHLEPPVYVALTPDERGDLVSALRWWWQTVDMPTAEPGLRELAARILDPDRWDA